MQLLGGYSGPLDCYYNRMHVCPFFTGISCAVSRNSEMIVRFFPSLQKLFLWVVPSDSLKFCLSCAQLNCLLIKFSSNFYPNRITLDALIVLLNVFPTCCLAFAIATIYRGLNGLKCFLFNSSRNGMINFRFPRCYVLLIRLYNMYPRVA